MSNITYNKTERLRFWCQKVLPIVYDDSLSYYELLNKVVVYLNSTIEDVQAMIEDVTRIEQGLSSKIDVSQKGVVNGVATLDGNGHVPLSQLPDISTGVQTISVNGINVPADDNKNVNIIVMTNAVSNLVNYYLKTETYNKTEVNALIDNVKNSRFEVVAQLPTTDIQTNVIYLVAKSVGQTQNGYDEFININGTTSGWELIGSTDIDLSGYVTDSELATVLNNYVTTQFLNTALAGYVTSIAFNTLVDRVIAVEGKIPSNASSSNQLVDSATLTNGLSGKADVFDVDGWTIDWLQGVGIPDKLYVMEHDEIPQEGTESSGLPNDEAVRKAVKSAYDLMEDTVGWSGKNKLEPVPYKNVTISGIQWTINTDGTVTANGTATALSMIAICERYGNTGNKRVFPNGRYIISGAISADYYIQCGRTYNNAYSQIGEQDTGNGSLLVLNGDDGSANEVTLQIICAVKNGKTANNVVFKPMLRDADILDPTYEPYRGTTAFPRDEQAILGAKNLCPFNFTVATPYGITWTIANGVIDADGTTETGKTSQAINSFIAPFSAQMIINGCNSGQTNVHMFPYDKTDSARPYTDSTKTTRMASSDNVYNGNEQSFYMEEGHEYAVYCRILGSSDTTVTVNHQKFYPMLRLATDTDDTFVPYAMTNRELTNKVQGILDAAANAADFAAFQAALVAL